MFPLIQPLKSHKPPGQVTLSESITTARLLPATWVKVLPARAISQLLLTSLPLSSVKLCSWSETTSTPFQHQLLTSMPQMVSFPEPFQWVLPVPELMETMLWPVGRLHERLVSTSWRKRNHTSLSSWHTESAIIQLQITLPCTETRTKERNGKKRTTRSWDLQNS